MELTSLVKDAQKKGEIVPRGSFEEIFNIVVDRHLPEHISYNHLAREEAKKDFETRYRGLAKKMYDDCFGSGKAVFDSEKYSCGLFGVAERVVFDMINSFLESQIDEKNVENTSGFVRNYAFVLKEIFCEYCSSSSSCVDYQSYVRRGDWKKYIPELAASAGE